MSLRQFIKLVLIIDVMLLIAIISFGLYTYSRSEPIVIEAEENGITVNYSVERSHILSPSECLTFSWEVNNISSVYFNGKGVGGVDQSIICSHNNVPINYHLQINGQNGEELTYTIPVNRAISFPRLLMIALPLLIYIFYHTIQKDVASQSVVIDTRKNWRDLLMLPLVIFSPILMISFYLFIRHDATLLNTMPFLSDGVYVWHQAASFAKTGLESGYYTVSENPARASMIRFYAWGPFVSILYGSIGSLIGTPLSLIVIVNQVCISLATLLYVVLVRPNIKQSLLLIGIFALYAPSWIYTTVSMDVLLQLSIGIAIAAGFWKLIENDANPSLPIRYGLGIALVLSAFCIRPTWGLLLLPYAILAFPKHQKIAFVLAGIVFLSGILGQSYFSAPYPSFRTQLLATAGDDILKAIQALAEHLITQLSNFFKVFTLAHVTQQRIQSAFIIVLSLIGVLTAFYQRKTGSGTKINLYLWGTCLYILISVYLLLAAVLDVQDFTELRWVAPYLLMIILLLIAAKRYMVVLLIILFMGLYLIPTIRQFDVFSGRALASQNHELFATSGDLLDPIVQYDPDAENPWCNTVLFELSYITGVIGNPTLLSFDPGIGLSWTRTWETSQNLQSQYFVVVNGSYDSVEQNLNVQFLQDLPQARLYLNLDADCESLQNG